MSFLGDRLSVLQALLSLLCHLVVSVSSASSPAQAAASNLQARFKPTGKQPKASAASLIKEKILPGHCELAIVGSGWGGAYFAWRLAIDTARVSPTNICVFEANGRIGGRIYSIHDIPHFDDLVVDVGGYRFLETDLLPGQLIQNALKLPTTCYDWRCQRHCDPDYPNVTCHVISDVYGNNAGYSTAIEVMLGQIEAAGSGQQIFLGNEVVSVDAASVAGHSAIRLGFQDGTSVTASQVLLNIPRNAIENLASTSLLFTETSSQTQEFLNAVQMGVWEDAKVYAYYKNAWWNSYLGLMEGFFKSPPGAKDIAPLMGRYHDGPQKCVVGVDAAGKPIFSGKKVQFGNCSGALEVFYSKGSKYYRQFMRDHLSPLTVVTAEHATGQDVQLLKDVHTNLVDFHAAALEQRGIEPQNLPGPDAVVVANWIASGNFTPGIGHFVPSSDAARAVVRKPVKDYPIYIANVDYGYRQGWATGSLIMAEKILQAELGVAAPEWLDERWYRDNILSKQGTSITIDSGSAYRDFPLPTQLV